MRWLAVLPLLLCIPFAAAQTSPVEVPESTLTRTASAPLPATDKSHLSPQAAYDEAMRPLDIVRRSVANWSDSETAALGVGMQLAGDTCLRHRTQEYSGEDLIAYARLCSFGQKWGPVVQAAQNYRIAYLNATPAEQRTNFPSLSTAFDYEVQASLRLEDSVNAYGTVQTMLRTVAYDELASDATNSTVRYVQLIHTDQALILLAQRQPLLLALLKAQPASAATPNPRQLSLHALYADAIALPAMQQFANQPQQAAASFAELEAALPANLSSDDAIFIAQSRRQYLLLGSPLPDIHAFASLRGASPSTSAQDRNIRLGSATVLLLFPDWCAQCVTMGLNFTPESVRLADQNASFYALLAQNAPPPAPEPAPKIAPAPTKLPVSRASRPTAPTVPRSDTPPAKITAADLLAGTPTLVVPTNTLNTFYASDFPLIIATDSHGIIRYIQTSPENSLVEGGLISQIAARILEQWPAKMR